jgi:hypothetical protein
MKKIHLKENAKIFNLFDTNLGDYNDEEEEMLVQDVSRKMEKLQNDIFSFLEYVESKKYGVVSERAEREFDEIIDTLNRIIENA